MASRREQFARVLARLAKQQEQAAAKGVAELAEARAVIAQQVTNPVEELSDE